MGMQGRGRARGRRYVALLMSLLLMMAAWQTLAVAAEGDTDAEAVAAEEVVPEVDEAVETDEAVTIDEAAATVDEEAASEQDVQAEEVQEPAESDQVEEEVATDAAAPETEAEEQAGDQAEQVDVDDQADGALQVQSSESELSFADGAIRVENLSAGEVTYDEASNRLTLNAATMSYLEVNTSVTIVLVGENNVEETLRSNRTGITITIDAGEGSGNECRLVVGDYDSSEYWDDPDEDIHSFNIADNYDFQCAGNVIVKGGTVHCNMECKDFSISGGTVTGNVSAGRKSSIGYDDWDLQYTLYSYIGVVTVTGGTIGGDVFCKDFSISGGVVAGYVLAGRQDNIGYNDFDEPDFYSTYNGTVTITGGSVGGNVACKDFSITAGTVGRSVYCECDVELANAGVSIGSLSANNVTISAGTVTGNVSAGYQSRLEYGEYPVHSYSGTVTMIGGTVGGDVNCGDFSINGGTVAGGVSAGLREHLDYDDWGGENIVKTYVGTVTMTDGSIGGGVNCKNFSIAGGTVGGRVSCECDVELATEGVSIGGLSAKNVTISAGTVTGGVSAGCKSSTKYDESDEPYTVKTYTGTVVMTGGTVKGGVNAKTLTLKGGSVSGRVSCTTFRMYEGAKLSAKGSGKPLIDCTTFTMWGGTIALSNCNNGIFALEKFSMAGGTISAKGSSDKDSDDAAVEAGYTFYMKGGTINTYSLPWAISSETATIAGGTVKGAVVADTVTMSKGTITGNVDCLGTMKLSGGTINYVGKGSGKDKTSGVSATTLSMAGGSIQASRCRKGISVSKSFTMSKGTITIASCDYGISAYQNTIGKTANITIKGGKTTVTNSSNRGIQAAYGNITMTGGTVSVTGSYKDAVYAHGTTYRGTKYGGKIKITGGKLTAKVRKPGTYAALKANYGVTNTATCLAGIAGSVDKGTSFKVGGNTYKVNEQLEVRLAKYESSKTKASLTDVEFGGNTYNVFGVATDAFATAQGKKVTSLSFGNTIEYLGSYAFRGTSSLTTLKIYLATDIKRSGSTWKVTTMKGSGSYAKTAFKGAGKDGGKGLTVKTGWKETNSAYRTYLRSLGLSSGAKVVGS